jgi:hypothetical protein
MGAAMPVSPCKGGGDSAMNQGVRRKAVRRLVMGQIESCIVTPTAKPVILSPSTYLANGGGCA